MFLGVLSRHVGHYRNLKQGNFFVGHEFPGTLERARVREAIFTVLVHFFSFRKLDPTDHMLGLL